MKKRLNILSILVFIVLGLSLYTTGYQFGTGMKAGMSLAKEQHKESKACDRPMLAGDFRFVDVVPTIAMINRIRSSMPKTMKKCLSCIRKWRYAPGKK